MSGLVGIGHISHKVFFSVPGLLGKCNPLVSMCYRSLSVLIHEDLSVTTPAREPSGSVAVCAWAFWTWLSTNIYVSSSVLLKHLQKRRGTLVVEANSLNI